jgi:D-alanyl-D-alanine carboxypeptidase
VGGAGAAIDIDELQTKPDFSGARTLVAHKSPPLRQLVSSMMKVSQNQYAETLLRHLGLSRRRDNTAKTDEMGAIGASGAIGATAATGLPAVAMSETSAATGLPAVAMGETRAATGLPAVAMGETSAATGLPAVAMGETSAKAGAARAREVLQAWNISDDSLVIADGSGLSRYNYVTSEALVRILHVMRSDSRHATAFVDSLPLAGRDGTLARRLAGTAAEGKVRAKTGTVDNVRAIAGYVETADGETLLFSMIANNFTAANSTVDAAADSALVRLATFTRR